MTFVLGASIGFAILALASVAFWLISVSVYDRQLSRFLVPSGSDSRWTFRADGKSVECGPFWISTVSGGVFIDGGPANGISAEAGIRRVRQIERARGREAFSEATSAKRVRAAQHATALAWHRANEPKPLPPGSAEMKGRLFR